MHLFESQYIYKPLTHRTFISFSPIPKSLPRGRDLPNALRALNSRR